MSFKRGEKEKRSIEKTKNDKTKHQIKWFLLLFIALIFAGIAIIKSSDETTVYTQSGEPVISATRIPRYAGSVSNGYDEINRPVVDGSVSSDIDASSIQTPVGDVSSDNISSINSD